MANEPYLFGAGGLIIGVVLGMMSSGPDTSEMEDRLVKKLSTAANASAKATEDQIAALTKRIGGIETSLAAGVEQRDKASQAVSAQIEGAVTALTESIGKAGEAQTADVQAAVGSQIGALGADLDGFGTGLDGIGTQLDALGSQIDEVGGTVAAITETMRSHHAGESGQAGTQAAHTAEVEAEAKPAAQPEPAPQPEGTAVGKTEIFMDGKVRVFVSGINAEAGTARVAINGLALDTLSAHDGITFDVDGASCELILDNITDGRVEMSPSCPE